jgi:SAM-dependent methyltransferase
MPVDFYNRNAATYFRDTVGANVASLHVRFLQHLVSGACILDAGCGSGRDVRAFHEAGYDVVAFDGSAEMAKLASAYTGLEVQQLTFEDMEWEDAFDGIWASASLLHVPRGNLIHVFKRFARALKKGGVWYLSMKHGHRDRVIDGRHFTDIAEPELRQRINTTGLKVKEVWLSDDVRPGRSDRWINAIVIRRD